MKNKSIPVVTHLKAAVKNITKNLVKSQFESTIKQNVAVHSADGSRRTLLPTRRRWSVELGRRQRRRCCKDAALLSTGK
jgi:hypothetical protein